MGLFFIISVIFAAGVFFNCEEKTSRVLNWTFYLLQGLFAVLTAINQPGEKSLEFFRFDDAGMMFFVLMSVIGPIVYYHSLYYLDSETPRQKATYNSLLILLSASIAGVYFSENIAVTWIFLEATTLCMAGLLYHRRSNRSLEATWKYIFVCSVGIAIAYLGILLLGAISEGSNMDYPALASSVLSANPLYMKIAFVFILAGYSCKMEAFPLYTIGIDANYAAPAPAAAFISTALVNAGFLSLYRVYEVMRESLIGGWMANVLIITGIVSVMIGAIFMRHTNHYKRFLSYSTVENVGIALIGMGVGGAGVFAAIFHMTAHSLIKSAMFLQIAKVGKTYGTYHMNRTGDYTGIDGGASALLMVTTVLLLAFPPSPLFISEIMIMKQIILNGQWWLLGLLVILICVVIYNAGRHILRLCYRPLSQRPAKLKHVFLISLTITVLVIVSVAAGIWQPEWLFGLIEKITVRYGMA